MTFLKKVMTFLKKVIIFASPGCRNKCGNVHCGFNFIFFNPICEKTINNTLLIFVYVLVNP